MLTLDFTRLERFEQALCVAEIRFVTPRLEGVSNALEAEVIFFSMPGEGLPC